MLGEAQEKSGNLKEASKNYALAYKKVREDDTSKAIFKTNMERVSKLLKENTKN